MNGGAYSKNASDQKKGIIKYVSESETKKIMNSKTYAEIFGLPISDAVR